MPRFNQKLGELPGELEERALALRNVVQGHMCESGVLVRRQLVTPAAGVVAEHEEVEILFANELCDGLEVAWQGELSREVATHRAVRGALPGDLARFCLVCCERAGHL